MKMMSTYSIRLRNVNDIRKALQDTADIYRKAVDFFIDVCISEWAKVSACHGQKERVNLFSGPSGNCKGDKNDDRRSL